MPFVDHRLLPACQQRCGLRPVLFYQRTFQPTFPMQSHRHITIEIMYAESNTFFVQFPPTADDSKPVTVRVRQGELIFINSLVYHQLLLVDNPARIFNVEFKEEPFDNESPYSTDLHTLYQNSPVFRDFIDEDRDYVVISANNSLRHLILDIHACCRLELEQGATDPTNHMLMDLLTTQFFLKCSSAYYDGQRDLSSSYIREIQKHVTQNLDQELRLNDIATAVNINPSYMETLFKKKTGTTIVEYINQQRILKAVSYLNSTNQSITDIGYLIGYNNRQHFSRVFRKIMGLSPGQYRKNLQSARIQNYTDEGEPIVENYYR